MYKDDILNLIEQSPLEIDTEIQMSGHHYYQGSESAPFSGVRNYPILRDNK